MQKYRVFVEGLNFLLEMGGEIRKFGFFTNRYIEAESSTQAERQTLGMIRGELDNFILNDDFDPPIMYIDQIVPLPLDGIVIPLKGFTFYPEI